VTDADTCRPDGDRDTGAAEAIDGADRWDRAGRAAVADVLERARGDLDGVAWDLVDDLMGGEDPTPEQVRQARRNLNEFYLVLERFVAPAAGLESWGGELPDIPYGPAREHYGPKGDPEGDDE
jgi:hypothetical protein